MQKKRILDRILSMVLTVALLISAFTVFASASDGTEQTVTDEVYYNRSYGDGWNYANGFEEKLGDNSARIVRESFIDGTVNYFVSVRKESTGRGYLYLDTDGVLPKSGKVYFELDMRFDEGSDLGTVVSLEFKSGLVGSKLQQLVQVIEGEVLVLGDKVADADGEWLTVSFEFDFDYATEGSEYKLNAYANEKSVSKVYTAGSEGFNIRSLRIGHDSGYGDFLGYTFGVDNVKLYVSSSGFTELDSSDYGTLVDTALEKNEVTLKDVIFGSPVLDRGNGSKAAVYLNRSFDEGTAYNVGFASDAYKTNRFELDHEMGKGGKKDQYLKMYDITGENSFLQLSANGVATGKLYLEFDFLASAGCNIGNLNMIRGVGGKNYYFMGVKEGYLTVFGEKVGMLGNDWIHIVCEFDLDYGRNGGNAGEYLATVWYGDKGKTEGTVCTFGDNGEGINNFRIGFDLHSVSTAGQWIAYDDMQLYVDEKPQSIATPAAPDAPDGDEGDEGDGGDDTTEGSIVGAPTLERESYGSTEIIYNRDFDEGWYLNNGMSVDEKGNIIGVEFSSDSFGNINYFAKFQAENSSNGYASLTSGNLGGAEKIYLEFDLLTSDICNVGNAIMILSPGASGARKSYYIMGFSNNQLTLFGNPVGLLSGEWTHIAIELDYGYGARTPGAKDSEYLFTCYYGDSGKLSKVLEVGTAGGGLGSFRIGFQGAPSNSWGEWFAMDNLQLYASKGFTTLPEGERGVLVNSNKPLDFSTQGSSSSVTIEDYTKHSLFFKSFSDYMLIDGVRTPVFTAEDGAVYGAPIFIDGELMMPLDVVLDFVGYPVYRHSDGRTYDVAMGDKTLTFALGRSIANLSGERIDFKVAPTVINKGAGAFVAVAASDFATIFPDFTVEVDQMGMIAVTPYAGKVALYDYGNRMEIMKQFIFHYATEEEMFAMAKENTNDFDHPYILGDQARFDEMRAVYESEEGDEVYDARFKSILEGIVRNADSSMTKYGLFDKDGKYTGLNPEEKPVNPYPDNNGYDVGGRLSVPTGNVDAAAFAYQITGDLSYAQYAYDFMVAIGAWEHWGPGHFLNTADTTAPFAKAFDWAFDGFVELGLNVELIADIIHSHGVYQGLLWIRGTPNIYGRPQGKASLYSTMENNWNAICTAGMTLGSMVLLEFDKYRDDALETASFSFEKLCLNGMSYYAPDGSYEESGSYWNYGASSVFLLSATLKSCLGDDLGLMDCWGLDRTCYYACHIQSSDYRCFSYNDGDTGYITANWFFYVADCFDDEQLSAIKHIHLQSGKGASIQDAFYYIPESEEEVELDLQYTFEGIHGMTVRDSWDSGALFAGMLAGDNADGHGQVDCGTWVYHNKGIIWISDLGADQYNVVNYFGNDLYYRKNAEGNNCLAIVSQPDRLPHGQGATAVGTLLDSGHNDHGAYFISDNTSVYGGLVEYAYRGMFVTNDRKTVVIQDEVSSKGIQSYYWFAHYDITTVGNPTLSADKLSATFTAYKGANEYTLRATLVSPNKAFRFEVMDCYTFCLENTVRPGWSEENGGQPEYSRENINRLVIKGDEVLSVKIAVVLEIIDPEAPVDVGYTWTEMSKWAPYADTRVQVEKPSGVPTRKNASLTLLRTSALKLDSYREQGDAFLFGERYNDLYRSVTDMEYVVQKFSREEHGTGNNEQLYNSYDTYYGLLNGYITAIGQRTDATLGVVSSVMGLPL